MAVPFQPENPWNPPGSKLKANVAKKKISSAQDVDLHVYQLQRELTTGCQNCCFSLTDRGRVLGNTSRNAQEFFMVSHPITYPLQLKRLYLSHSLKTERLPTGQNDH